MTLTVLGPKLLGHATDLIFGAVVHQQKIDFTALRGVLLTVLALYVGAAGLSYLQSYTLAGVVQRTMYRLRSDVEDKLTRLPLSYVDGQPRGDLLSRVTNDIDNIAQSLQQTLSQLLTSLLTLVGVLTMMFIISPILAAVAALTIPASLLIIRLVTSRSKKRFVAQWRHRHAQRPDRRGVHGARSRQGVPVNSTPSRIASATRTRSSTPPASARSSSPGSSSR